MATHKSAEKRHRQSLKRRTRNRTATSSMKTVMKGALQLASTGKSPEAIEALKKAVSQIDKAAIHGVIHKKNAQRKISRLTKTMNAKLASATQA